MRRRIAAVPLAVALTLALSACGSSASGSQNPDSDSAILTVFAAASLTNVFPKIANEFKKAHPGVAFRFSFAGTDTLTAQIEQGAPADVFAGASTEYGEILSGKGLIDAPRPMATNRLILILPPSNPAGITSLRDLAKPGVKLVIGDTTVPVGVYTRTVLANLDSLYGPDYSKKVLANVVSDEVDVTSVLTKVELGEADAGFVYVTDAIGAGGKVARVVLPAQAQATATYPLAVVKASKHSTLAGQFVTFVLGPSGQALLKQAGFGPPPP